MKKRTIISIIIVFVLVLLGTMIYVLKPASLEEPPEIRVTYAGKEITYSVGKNHWNNAVYDRMDVLQYVLTKSSGSGPVSVPEGETIEIEILGKMPLAYTLTEEVIDASGEIAPWDSRKDIPIKFKNGKGSFVLSESDAASGEEEQRGFRLTCKWGKNDCEYGFVITVEK